MVLSVGDKQAEVPENVGRKCLYLPIQPLRAERIVRRPRSGVAENAQKHLCLIARVVVRLQGDIIALQTIPGLQRIDVALEPHYDTGDETKVLLRVLRDPATWAPNDPFRAQWLDWEVKTFPADVLWHLGLLVSYGKNHAG